MSSRDSMGRPVCQIRGCSEPARPWPLVYDFDANVGLVEVEVFLCGRHERDVNASVLTTPGRKQEAE